MRNKSIYIVLAFISFFSNLSAQIVVDKIDKRLLNEQWPAKWITHPSASKLDYGVFHFRNDFQLESVPDEFIIHISADNRYKFYVNGHQVSMGPAIGDLLHWRFETVDISSRLKKGSNVIAALVWNYGEERPLHQISFKTALIVQGNGDVENVVNTNVETWKVIENDAYYPIHIDWRVIGPFYYASVPGDSILGQDYPWDWNMPNYDTKSWLQPVLIGYGSQGIMPGYHYFTGSGAWKLVPNMIPPMANRRQRFAKVVRTRGIAVTDDILTGKSPMIFPPNQEIKILLDQSELTRAYPSLTLSGGLGSKIRITYAEALFDKDFQKGNRNDTEGKEMVGMYDVILPEGGDHRMYTTNWHRVFRFVELHINTRGEPLILENIHSVYSGYPFDLKAEFHSDQPILEQIFDAGYYTLKIGTGEIYEDGPYYEQLMYAGDARIASLLAMYLTGDDRMTKRMIDLFDGSRTSEGLTYARYPSNVPQINPQYSLAWIQAIYDHLMMSGDTLFARDYLDGISSVLLWHENLIDSTGMLGVVPWLRHIEAKSGTPKHPERGHSAQQTLFYALTLSQASEIFDFYGMENKAAYYAMLSESLKAATWKWCYDENRGLIADTPEKDIWTQHANTLGILIDAIPEKQQGAIMRRILYDTTLVPGYLFFKSYIFEALNKCGMGELYIDQLGPWRAFMNYGLTTFPEFKVESRSDCHAWSAHPAYGMLNTVCGIRSLSPGFKKILIEPHPGELKDVRCLMPHPGGEILVQMKMKSSAGYELDIRIPAGVETLVKWKGQLSRVEDSSFKTFLKIE